jgi:hypothetical protein
MPDTRCCRSREGEKYATRDDVKLTLLQSHSGFNLAAAFAQILDEFGIAEKVSTQA